MHEKRQADGDDDEFSAPKYFHTTPPRPHTPQIISRTQHGRLPLVSVVRHHRLDELLHGKGASLARVRVPRDLLEKTRDAAERLDTATAAACIQSRLLGPLARGGARQPDPPKY